MHISNDKYKRLQGQQELGVRGANGSSMKGSRLQTSNIATILREKGKKENKKVMRIFKKTPTRLSPLCHQDCRDEGSWACAAETRARNACDEYCRLHTWAHLEEGREG